VVPESAELPPLLLEPLLLELPELLLDPPLLLLLLLLPELLPRAPELLPEPLPELLPEPPLLLLPELLEAPPELPLLLELADPLPELLPELPELLPELPELLRAPELLPEPLPELVPPELHDGCPGVHAAPPASAMSHPASPDGAWPHPYEAKRRIAKSPRPVRPRCSSMSLVQMRIGGKRSHRQVHCNFSQEGRGRGRRCRSAEPGTCHGGPDRDPAPLPRALPR
jgi:hypothetical protein